MILKVGMIDKIVYTIEKIFVVHQGINMKFYWYLSIILVSLLHPNLALSQEIEENPTPF